MEQEHFVYFRRPTLHALEGQAAQTTPTLAVSICWNPAHNKERARCQRFGTAARREDGESFMDL